MDTPTADAFYSQGKPIHKVFSSKLKEMIYFYDLKLSIYVFLGEAKSRRGLECTITNGVKQSELREPG